MRQRSRKAIYVLCFAWLVGLSAHRARATIGTVGTRAGDSTVLELRGERFQVRAAWRSSASQGEGRAFPLTDESGYFTFFNSSNLELVVKVLDACELPGYRSFWVFSAGLTDLEVELSVTDLETGRVWRHTNPLGSPFAPIQDTQAFACDSAPDDAGPQIFGVIEDAEDFGRTSFFSRFGALVLEALPEEASGLEPMREASPNMLMLMSINPYFYWEDPLEVRPELVLRTDDGDPIRYSGPLYAGMDPDHLPVLMDIRIPAWQLELSQAVASLLGELGIEGVLLDTWTVAAPGWAYHKDGRPPAGYSDPLWRQSMLDFTESMIETVGPDPLIVFNGLSVAPPEAGLGPDAVFLESFDGASYEAYSIYLQVYRDDVTKRHYFDHAIQTAMRLARDEGKLFFLEAQGSESNERARLYALTAYLLLQYEGSFFYYDDQTVTPESNWFPEWDVSLGAPLGDLSEHQGAFQREFEHALVMVNPSSSVLDIDLESSFLDHAGRPVESPFQLGAFEGEILRKPAGESAR